VSVRDRYAVLLSTSVPALGNGIVSFDRRFPLYLRDVDPRFVDSGLEKINPRSTTPRGG